MRCQCVSITELNGTAAKQYADEHLVEVKTDAVNWTVEYVCPETNRRFLLDYPQSELHGGGPPRLTPIQRSNEMSGYVAIARDAFAFLESEYQFSITDWADANGGGQITYVNVEVGVGVKAVYEFSNAFVFVFIYHLVDGQLRDNVLPMTDESEITCFDFNDALSADQKMKPAYEYGDDSVYCDQQNGLRNYVREFATRLQRNGNAFLSGNFEAMPGVEETIKRRARALNQESR